MACIRGIYIIPLLFMAEIEELEEIRAFLKASLDRIDGLIAASLPEELWSKGFQVPNALDSEQYRTVAIERVLEANYDLRVRGRPVGSMRPTEIRSVLESVGRPDPPMEVQVTTFDLAQRNRIEKVGRGLYRAKRRS